MIELKKMKKFCCVTANREYCSYVEFKNASLPYSDVALMGFDEKQVIFYYLKVQKNYSSKHVIYS